jgi:hypothetical protein
MELFDLRVRPAVFVICALVVISGSPALAADWRVPGDFATIQDAVASPSVADGDRILVGPGLFAGALIDKPVHIQGQGRTTTIASGPDHSSGMSQGFRLLAGSDGTTITRLRFTVDLAVIAGADTTNVTVSQNTFVSPVQGISAWRASGWEITHNDITDLRTSCGGGIGILVGDYNGGSVTDNVVSHNRIHGTLRVADDDCGNYNGSGIVVYADYRWGRLGSTQIAFNRIVKNDISLTSDNPSLVDVVALELTEASAAPLAAHVIHDNAIGFNDCRGTTLQVVLSPEDLADVNSISRNLGENRAKGLHPSAFGPID